MCAQANETSKRLRYLLVFIEFTSDESENQAGLADGTLPIVVEGETGRCADEKPGAT